LSKQFISEEQVEKALDYLRDTALDAARATAERIYLEEYTRVIKSKIMQEHRDDSLGAQEREAYADQRYKQHLEAVRIAIEQEHEHRFRRQAAAAKIEAWRTMCSNERAMKL
jgi:predicted nucleic acid-binding protein